MNSEAKLLQLKIYFEKRDFEKSNNLIKELKSEKYFELKDELIDIQCQIEAKENQYDYYKKSYPSYIEYIKFIKWLNTSIESYFPKLELKYFSNDHRGVFAKTKIYKDEAILRVPYNKLITLEIARESIIGMQIINNGLSLLSPKHCFLSAYLLQEKVNKESKWKEFLKIIPAKYDNFPIFFDEIEMSYLEGSPFLSK